MTVSDQHLVYRAEDWLVISQDLPPTEPLTRHLRDKARAAARRFDPCYPLGETVDAAKALDIRKSAHLRGIQEAEAESR